MYGLKLEDISKLNQLCNCQLFELGVGEYVLQFRFEPQGNISVESHCELIDSVGKILDSWSRGKRSSNFLFVDLVGQTIRSFEIDTPKSFIATFSDGKKLRVLDDSEQYESFAVNDLVV